MKAVRDGWRPLQRQELRDERVHDAYKSSKHLRAPAHCPDCGAIYVDGRWRWGSVASGAHAERCPACHRIHDHFPAGFVTLSGAFLAAHRAEIEQLVRHREGREKAQHPLERIIAIEDTADGILITTTGIHLARALGDALEAAYKGQLDYHYNDQESLLRVQWTR